MKRGRVSERSVLSPLENRPERHFKAFTLVELVVVISIIMLLAALLMPALRAARYKAKIAGCVNNMRQMCVGVMMYANDYAGYYPDGAEIGRPDPSVIAWVGAGGLGNFDLRPALRSYFGTKLNTIMKCPLSADYWWQGKPHSSPSDIDSYGMGASNRSKSPYAFYFGKLVPAPSLVSVTNWPRTEPMLKPGQTFVPTHTPGIHFNVLMSDFVNYQVWQGLRLITTHQSMNIAAPQDGNFTNDNVGYGYWPGKGQFTCANFALDDGSIKTYYNIGVDSYANGTFTTFGPGRFYMLPTECGH